MLLYLVKRGHPVDFISSHDTAVSHAVRPLARKPRLHDPSRRTASMPVTWTSSLQSRGYNGRMPRRKRKARTPHARRSSVWQGLSSWCAGRHRASNHVSTRKHVATPAHSSTGLHAPCGSQATLFVGGAALPHTEETGPPRPPPEPPPGVSTAPPRRTTSSRSTSPCPSCCSVFSSVQNMKAHARRTIPGTPIVAEGLTCGFCDGSTVSPTSASRAGHYRKCQACRRAKNGQRNSATPNDSRSPSATPLLQPHQPLSRDNTREALPHMFWECPRPRQLSIRIL
ncbi:hypothetical protein TcG_01663 [Trypanosoma cruzi]|nr:hypothetical protein TcG_01663 [Trypanosoma cruzi]